MGEMNKAPSGVNCAKKLTLLGEEGVAFDGKGMLIERARIWDGFKVEGAAESKDEGA